MNPLSKELQCWINKQGACWRGYEQVGMKMLDGREVPNCVPASKSIPNSKPKKKKTEKKADLHPSTWYPHVYNLLPFDNRIGNALAGAVFGYLPGKALGALGTYAVTQNEKDTRVGMYTGAGIGSAAGALLGLLTSPETLKKHREKVKKHVEQARKKLEKAEKKSNDQTLARIFADVPMICTPGIGCKRQLTDQELQEIAEAKSNIFPKLFPQDYDPVSSMMSSPEWAGVGTGALGALGLGGLGALGASMTNRNPLLYSAIAAALGGLGGGLYGYLSKKRRNAELEDIMEDLPVGGDIGDIEIYSDPKIRATVSRDFQRQLVRRGLM